MFFKSCSPLLVTLIVYVIFLFAYTNLFSPIPVVAIFSTVKSGVCGVNLSATSVPETTTADGVHQSQNPLEISFSFSSILVIVDSPISLTFLLVVFPLELFSFCLTSSILVVTFGSLLLFITVLLSPFCLFSVLAVIFFPTS